ncbi:hypothetical protein GCM10009558_012910 [Virgisporangium aurantiacum]
MAAAFAERVYDPDFRTDRIALVELHRQWCHGPVPTADQAHERLSRMTDLDTRAAYRHHVAARWSAAGTATAARRVASLVPSALFDSTGLDALLAQAIGFDLRERPQAEVEAIAAVVADSFTTGRPWTFGRWR